MSGAGSPRKDRKRWLIVEGSDDLFVTVELLGRHGAFWGDATREASADLPHIFNAGSIDNLRETAAVEAKGRHRLGVILDADVDAERAWSKLRRRLCGIADPPAWLSRIVDKLPEALPREGIVSEEGERALGVWVMPDNGARGALEDFLVALVPPGNVHWGPACEGVAAAITRGVRFPEHHRAKAEIHTWLAWQREPGVPFGRAMKSAYFLHDAAGAMAFIAWFRRMFPGESEATGEKPSPAQPEG